MDGTQPISEKAGDSQPELHHRAYHAALPQLLLILPLLSVLAGTLAVLAPIWQAGYPWGSDTWGHLQRAAFMGDLIRAHGPLNGIIQSAWMPDWYLGDPMRVYYPPLTVWVLGPLTALVGDVFLAYRLLVTVIFLLLGWSIYTVGVWWGQNRWLAALGALLAVSAPYTLRTVFVEGNLPRGLALLPLPWIMWYSEQLLTEKRITWSFALLAGLWASAIVAHVMQAAIFALAVGMYVVFRCLTNVYIPLRRGVLALVPLVLGGGIAAAYLLPAYSHAELHNVPSLPEAKIALFSISADALLPNHLNIEAISLGVAGAVCALIITFRTTKDHHKALLAAGMISVALAFGPAGGVYRLIPMHQQLLPERFLNVSAIFFPLIIATAPPGIWKMRWAIVAFVLVLVIDGRPAWRAVQMRAIPPDEEAIAQMLATESLPGRVAPLTFPNPRASQLYLTSEVGGHASVSGWALENTPNQNAVRRLLIATTRSPGYLQRVFALWNTDYLVTRFEDSAPATSLESALTYRPAAQADDLELWKRDSPSAFVQVLPDNRMVVIGENATDWLFAFPFASEGEYADPTAYQPEYFEHFSVIGLTRLPENAHVEAALEDWVREGHTLIVDLSGLGQLYDEGFTLFGVHAIPVALSGDYTVRWPRPLSALPDSLAFSTPEGSWVGATYYGLDAELATLSREDKTYALLGYQQIGEGRVWFVGLNLFYLLEQSGQNAVVDTLVNYLLDGTDVNRDLALPALDAEILQDDPTRIGFRYTSPTAVSSVVSMTYFPRWQATLDGQKARVGSHEYLVLLDLPAGTHTVTLQYRPFSTTVSKLGWGMSGLFIGVTGVVVYRLKRRPPLATKDRLASFDDRLPQTSPALSAGHASCPNCGFRLAKSGPPNEKSYPFASLDCPICGFSLGDSSFASGTVLRDATKKALAALWLRRSDISAQELKDQFGLTVDELFSPESDSGITPSSGPTASSGTPLS